MLEIQQPIGLFAALLLAVGSGAWARWRRSADEVGRRRTHILVGAGVLLVFALMVVSVRLALFVGAWWAGVLWIADAGRDALPTVRGALIALRSVAWLLVLVLVGRPTWEQVRVTWQKPVLAVLLDETRSMSLPVAGPGAADAAATRAAALNAVLDAQRPTLAQLATQYDVRLRSVGARLQVQPDWTVEPNAPLTNLAGALQEAAAYRDVRGQPPVAVLLMSDGAENVTDVGAVRAAATALAAQGTALWAVGVGPAPGEVPSLELDPLAAPPRVGLHDAVNVAVRGQARGCGGHTLKLELLWGTAPAANATVPLGASVQNFGHDFEVQPPGPGAQRLTLRAIFPQELGGGVFTQSTVVEVGGERVRVLFVERVPTYESSFALRAWRRDPELDPAAYYLVGGATGRTAADAPLADVIAGYDVVVLGRAVTFAEPAAEALHDAVVQRGVGLLVAGGVEEWDALGAPPLLAELLPSTPPDHPPVAPESDAASAPEQALEATVAGRRHPVLSNVFPVGTSTQPATEGTALPPLPFAAPLGVAKPVAEVLIQTASSVPALVAQEVGRGRCLLATWEDSWPWALATDASAAAHERLWRQMVAWLANRRPQAWITTDQPQYSPAALHGGQQRVRIHAGLSGVSLADADAVVDTRLTLRTPGAEEALVVPTQREADGWHAVLPDVTGGLSLEAPGRYVLQLEVRGVAGLPAQEVLRAEVEFAVRDEDLEQRMPTANLPLLQAAAGLTAGSGGRYVPLSELAAALAEWAQTDRRQRQAVRVPLDVTHQMPWGVLALLVGVLAAEWTVRKLNGLA